MKHLWHSKLRHLPNSRMMVRQSTSCTYWWWNCSSDVKRSVCHTDINITATNNWGQKKWWSSNWWWHQRNQFMATQWPEGLIITTHSTTAPAKVKKSLNAQVKEVEVANQVIITTHSTTAPAKVKKITKYAGQRSRGCKSTNLQAKLWNRGYSKIIKGASKKRSGGTENLLIETRQIMAAQPSTIAPTEGRK